MDANRTHRLEILRQEMKKQELQACIIPTADPHQSEYTADCWKFRAFLSGFTGSSGTLVVGSDSAGLWTDSRYFLQAEEELKGTGIELFRSGLPETFSPEEWIAEQGYRSVGLDGAVFSAKEVLVFSAFLSKRNIGLNTTFKPYTNVWPKRPAPPESEIFLFPESYAGESTENKLKRLRSEMEKTGSDSIPLSALDEIAWLFNLRGMDVDYNPVGICFAFVSHQDCVLFVDQSKLKQETVAYLKSNAINIAPYNDFPEHLSKLNRARILLDKAKINYQLFQSIPANCTVIEASSPLTYLKAIKNTTEIGGFRQAMIKDGIALVRFWKWLEESITIKGTPQNEWTIGEKIAEFRRQQPNYVCESFCPIVGYNDHGAIVHYEATPETAYPVLKDGFLLVDTGGQYLNGTTDITRSYSFYDQTPANYKYDYTCLLKGVIALSSAVFPTGTRGTQLDVLARQFLWKRNLNFLHGTGHGVGHFLNVHEGPQSIRMNENPTCLEPGMVLSNEPGLYRTGEYGIRLENLLLVREQKSSEFGKYLCFETLTLFPFDKNSIDKGVLTTEEINWLNDYHLHVYDNLAPGLNENERIWLKVKTTNIN
jgi:Xaa-Pro aminopeptidase